MVVTWGRSPEPTSHVCALLQLGAEPAALSKTTMIKELTTEIERLKLDLVATREKNGILT